MVVGRFINTGDQIIPSPSGRHLVGSRPTATFAQRLDHLAHPASVVGTASMPGGCVQAPSPCANQACAGRYSTVMGPMLAPARGNGTGRQLKAQVRGQKISMPLPGPRRPRSTSHSMGGHPGRPSHRRGSSSDHAPGVATAGDLRQAASPPAPLVAESVGRWARQPKPAGPERIR